MRPARDLSTPCMLPNSFCSVSYTHLARRRKKQIGMDEIEESMERVIAGPQRKGRVMTDVERTTIAYHESGHALVGHILEHSDPCLLYTSRCV